MNICNYKISNKERILINKLHSLKLTKQEKLIPYLTDEPKIPIFYCHPLENLNEMDIQAHGKGFDLKVGRARIKSIAEVLERLALLNPDNCNFVNGNYQKNQEKYLDPSIFCCYSKKQLDRKKYIQDSRKSDFFWWKSYDLTRGKNIFIPAQTLFLSDFSSEFSLRLEQISTGAAFGLSEDINSTIKRAFFEVIERDSDMLSYLTNAKIPHIVNLPNSIEKVKRYIERYNLEVHVLDSSTNLNIPSVICATIDKTGIGDAVNLGSASAETYEEAIIKSILESIQCRRAGRINDIINPNYSKKILESNFIKNIEDRYIYCKSKERIKDLYSWINNNLTIDYLEIKKKEDSFKNLLKRTKKSGLSVILSDITNKRLKNKGFNVLKITIPELLPLYISEDAKALYSEFHGEIIDKSKTKTHLFT